jgi:hypothetical protein
MKVVASKYKVKADERCLATSYAALYPSSQAARFQSNSSRHACERLTLTQRRRGRCESRVAEPGRRWGEWRNPVEGGESGGNL